MGLVVLFRAVGEPPDAEGAATVLLNGIMVAAVMPIVTITLAAAAFGNEVEDRTLGYLVLNPVSRWSIAVAKVLAPVVIAGPLMVVSGVLVVMIGLQGEPRAALAVAVGLLAGVAAYSAIFSWAGLLTGHAIGFGLVYVLVWEGLVTSFLSGVRYLSVRAYVLTLMEAIDDGPLDALQDLTIETAAALIGILLVSALFLCLSVLRLHKMDVP